MKEHKSFYNSERITDYYSLAEHANENFGRTKEFETIKKLIKQGDRICEFGCGEGGKLSTFQHEKVELYGIDISKKAIEKALERKENINFLVKDIQKTDFENETFDITMSFFVLEHIPNPEKVINEMLRTTKKGGYIVFWFPNYGSPLFPSPPSLYNKGNMQKIKTLIRRFISKYPKFYTNVDPIPNSHLSDHDTTTEIYMRNFIKYLHKKYLIEIIHKSSNWENMSSDLLFRIYLPFKMFSKRTSSKYMGPQCFLVLKKQG